MIPRLNSHAIAAVVSIKGKNAMGRQTAVTPATKFLATGMAARKIQKVTLFDQ